MILAADVVSSARRMIGTPFMHQGRWPGRGLDCAGLIICVARELGLGDWDGRDYGRLPNPRRMGMVLSDKLRAVTDETQPADVLWISFGKDPSRENATHLALVSDRPGYIIHAYQPSRFVCEHRLSDAMRGGLVGVFRYQGLA